MSNWLGIALGAYLIGALIEGVITVSQLSHSLPELVESIEDKTPPTPQKSNWLVLTIIIAVSIAGAFSWPCRLIHRSMKEQV